jgi:hypothetical protein
LPLHLDLPFRSEAERPVTRSRESFHSRKQNRLKLHDFFPRKNSPASLERDPAGGCPHRSSAEAAQSTGACP